MNVFVWLYSLLFTHPIWKFLVSVSILILSLMTIIAFSAGWFRRRGLDPRTAVAHLDDYPMVTVVMCCKGIHESSLSNFKRNLGMAYPGPVEFVFVVEAATDPGYTCAQQAIAETVFTNDNRRASVVVAGLSYHNAQKIHNMLYGVVSSDPDSQYVLFADDDVFLYPGLLEELIDPLVRESAHVLVSGGYEFIAPPPGSCIANYCLFSYRMHNLWSFITDRPILCWGGCWMAPLWVFRQNFSHLVDCYLDGGYSDDTIMSCIAQENGYVCAHPYRAIFPNKVSKETPFNKYWEFLKRQFFVTDTYSTPFNRSVVHSLAFLICSSVWLLAFWILFVPYAGFLGILATLTGGSFEWSYVPMMSLVTIGLWVLFLRANQFSVDSMVEVSNSVRPPDQQMECKLNPFKMAVGLCVHIFLMPVAVVVIMLSKYIVWAGVRYYKQGGKIWKVERTDANGNQVTELASASIARTLRDPRLRSLVSGRDLGATFEEEVATLEEEVA
jgi:hypothetical protein